MQFDFLPGAEAGMQFAAGDAILEDANGSYLWKIDNLEVGDNLPADRLLKVSKLRIEKKSLKLPFLGNWIFQQIEVLDASVDLKTTLVAAKLNLPEGEAAEWAGDTIRIEPERQWMIRPGDLVEVDLSESESQPGYFVPMDAIVFDDEKTYLMVTESSSDSETTVQRLEIEVMPATQGQPTSSIRRIQPAGELKNESNASRLDGRRYVTRGAHYLQEGHRVRVVVDPAKATTGSPESEMTGEPNQ